MKHENFINEKNISRVFNLCYAYAKGQTTKAIAAASIVDITKMKNSTATFHLAAMKAMFEGKYYSHRINLDVVEYFLEHILQAEGEAGAKRAAQSVMATADFMEEKTDFKDADKFRALAEKYL